MKKNFKKLWNKALKVIPGGNGLLSKGQNVFYQMDGLHILKKQKEFIFGI